MFETLQDAIKHYAKCMKCTISEAKVDAEREIALLMKNEGYTREFAESTWMEEQEELDAKELDKLDKEAKKNGATKVVATSEDKPKKKRAPRKPNEEKREIIKDLFDILPKFVGMNHAIVNPEREITFTMGDHEYSLTLVQHRKKKEG
jgi:hypothetical protein